MTEASEVELTPITTVSVQVPAASEKTASKDGDDDLEDKKPCCDIRGSEFFKVDRALLKYKSFFFFFLGAIGSVFPYFSVYFKQLGFSPNEIGIISGVRPLVGFFSGPLWGSIADRFRIRRIMLLISALGWLSFITSIGFVPPPKYDPDCAFVNVLKGNITHETYSGPTPELRPDATPDETLQEDRGWMFDTADLHRVFITILILVILGEVVQSPTGALADSGCVEELGSLDMHKYGHQRAWGSLSLGLFALIVGAVVGTTREDIKPCGVELFTSDYRVAFYFFSGCMASCFITCFFFKFQKQCDDHAAGKPRPNPLKVFKMFLTLHYGSWLFSMFFTGICNGVIWGFLFWHIENIGGTHVVMGLAIAVCHLSEIVMFYLVFRILKTTGCIIFMVVGFTGYSIRFLVFGLMENPWIVLPFEVLQGFTFAGIWSVYIKYLCESVPREFLGTLQGFLHGVYWGLGSGTGHMLGGILVETWGARVTFWIFAVASFVNMLIFLLIQKVTKKPEVFGNYEKIDE